MRNGVASGGSMGIGGLAGSAEGFEGFVQLKGSLEDGGGGWQDLRDSPIPATPPPYNPALPRHG